MNSSVSLERVVMVQTITQVQPPVANTVSQWEGGGISESSQGKIWHAKKIRTFVDDGRLNNTNNTHYTLHSQKCKYWAVITTIFEPTMLAEQLYSLPNWCAVFVGDKKSPPKHVWDKYKPVSKTNSRIVFLDVETQLTLPYLITRLCAWNHFSRKNIGFIYAIHHGAEFIYDTDDDNILEPGNVGLTEWIEILTKKTEQFPEFRSRHYVINPYIHHGVSVKCSQQSHFVWQRGFPLTQILEPVTYEEDKTTHYQSMVSSANVAIIQSVANHDPDVDGIYRLTNPSPLVFIGPQKIGTVIPKGSLTPFNAQAVIFRYDSFWGILLPATVHGRVSDIWRSYFTERILWELDLRLMFTGPFVSQYRNAHSFMADFNSESPLYTQAEAIVKYLINWRPVPGSTLYQMMEELIIHMYEVAVVEVEDVYLTKALIHDLQHVGYISPPLKTPFTGTVVENDKVTDNRITTQQVSIKRSRVAICVSGQPRSLMISLNDPLFPKDFRPMTVTNIPNADMNVSESIWTRLYPSLGDFDVFMFVQTTESSPREPKVGDTTVCDPLAPVSRENKLFCEVVKDELPEEYSAVNHPEQVWYGFGGTTSMIGKQGLMKQLYGMQQCGRMIEEEIKRSGKVYDHVIRLRPDTYFAKPIPKIIDMQFTDGKSNIIWYYSWQCSGGNVDTFAIGKYKDMKRYLNRIDSFRLSRMCKKNGFISESFLEEYMKLDSNVILKAHPDIVACVVKPKDRRQVSDP